MGVSRNIAAVRTTILMDQYTRAVVDSAAKYADQTRTAFIISAAREKAERIARERQEIMGEVAPMVLDAVDSKIFLEALERDFQPNQALRELNKTRHRCIIDKT